jgi:DNA (cytosine-5)-methyltransferase 1
VTDRPPVLLDLYCCAGGIARGFQQAGFFVVGVDTEPQPRYAGDVFHQADAVETLAQLVEQGHVQGHRPVAVHASPPCQRWAGGQAPWGRREQHPDLIGVTREGLAATGLPWVMENVVSAPLFSTFQLCGSSFGLRVRRHRRFESRPWIVGAPPCEHGWQDRDPIYPASWVKGKRRGRTGVVTIYGTGGGGDDMGKAPMDVRQEAMGIDWMTGAELSQAIPPAYGEWIGQQLMATIRPRAGVA